MPTETERQMAPMTWTVTIAAVDDWWWAYVSCDTTPAAPPVRMCPAGYLPVEEVQASCLRALTAAGWRQVGEWRPRDPDCWWVTVRPWSRLLVEP